MTEEAKVRKRTMKGSWEIDIDRVHPVDQALSVVALRRCTPTPVFSLSSFTAFFFQLFPCMSHMEHHLQLAVIARTSQPFGLVIGLSLLSRLI
jgi:hypothetical protein